LDYSFDMYGQVRYLAWMPSTERVPNPDAVYGALHQKILGEIKQGLRPVGSLLPGEKELAKSHGISRWAVREMLAKLAEEGLVRKVIGKGTVVVGHNAERLHRAAITLDLIIDNTDKLDANEYAFECLRRIQDSAHQMRRPFNFSYRLLDFSGRELEDRDSIRKSSADVSVIIPFSRQCRDFLEMHTGMDRLLIAFAAELSSNVVPQVFVDDVEGVKKGTRYLHHIGHRRIAMIAPTEYCYRNGYSRIRQETFISEMRHAGLEWAESMTDRVECAYAPIRNALTRWLERKDAPTAFFVADGNWISPVKAALDLLGRKVPSDITLISYDDVLESRMADPPVTVIRQPLEIAARRLYETILDHVESRPEAKLQQRVSPELIVRESSCPPDWQKTGESALRASDAAESPL
jgi:DNA-binding LacI/PurR family transcriptional regulator